MADHETTAPVTIQSAFATKMLRESWLRRGGESDFNRPLNYPRSGVASRELRFGDVLDIVLEKFANLFCFFDCCAS